jgi:hypothetical protein
VAEFTESHSQQIQVCSSKLETFSASVHTIIEEACRSALLHLQQQLQALAAYGGSDAPAAATTSVSGGANGSTPRLMMSGSGAAAGFLASTGGGRTGLHTQEMLHAWSMAGNRGTADGTTQQQQQVDRIGEPHCIV